MADKIRPLKIESPSNGGDETDMFPTEANPLEDYAALKGVAFENLDEFRVEKLGRVITELFPNLYQQLSYSGSNVDSITYFNSPSFIIANRIAKHDFTYSSNNLTSESLVLYAADGSTILRTLTWTHTYSGSNLQSSGLVIS